MKPVYVIRSNDGSGYHVKSFGVTVNGGEVHLTFEPFEALHFSSWAEAAAVAAFIIHHIDEMYEEALDIVKVDL